MAAVAVFPASRLATVFCLVAVSIPPILVSPAAAVEVDDASTCPWRLPRAGTPPPFLDDIRSICPRSLQRPSPPIEVSGETIVKELALTHRSECLSVLFYASWCPFSSNFRPIFDALSSMFPRVKHVAVEESSVMPSLLSRYGIRGFPSVLMANKTTTVRYLGPKALGSLVDFYKVNTGLDPVTYINVDNFGNLVSPLAPKQSLGQTVTSDPFMALSVLFVLLMMGMRAFPILYSCFSAFWALCARNINMGIFGGSSQVLERVLQVINPKRLWAKFRLCFKSWNFREGARNARVWASSFTSVSLGESSPLRQAS